MDYIESFVPFIATLIKRKNYAEIIPSVLCEDFKYEFGLVIPYHPMILILNRAKKRGMIKQEENKYLPVLDLIEKLDFSKQAQKHLSDYNRICTDFIKYTEKKYKTRFTTEEAEETLIAYLKEYDFEILFAAQNKSFLPEIKHTISKRNKYLINRYIKYLHDNNHELFKIVENLAVGYLVASPILYDNFVNYKGNFEGIDFYLDTNLILKALGSEGDIFRDNYHELLHAMVQQGGRLFAFLHTYEEMMGILKDCIRWIDNPLYDPRKASPTLRFFRHNNFGPSDIDLFIISIDTKLQDLNIKIVLSPDPNDSKLYQIDEEKLYNKIVETYIETHPLFVEEEKKYVILKDIKSIAAIAKLRRGDAPISIKNSKYILITTNSSLASASRKFEVEELKSENSIPSCMPDTFIGTLAWLQAPNRFVNLNEKKIVSDCYAAIQPSDYLISKYVDEIEKLRKEGKLEPNQYFVLRTHRFAYEMLQDRVMGDSNLITWKTPLELLKEMEERASRDERKKYRRELEGHEKTKSILEATISEKDKLIKRIMTLSRIAAGVIYWALMAILMFPAIVGIVIQVFPELIQFPKTMKIILLIYSAILAIAGIYSGFIIKGFGKKIKHRLEYGISKIFRGRE